MVVCCTLVGTVIGILGFMDASTIMCGLSFDKFEDGVDLEKVEDNAGGASHDRVKNLEIVKLY